MIRAVNLTKRYGGAVAVENLSFDVPAGTLAGLLGPPGAGKTTTMRLALGLDMPTSGRVTIGGKRYEDLGHPLRTVGTSFAHPAPQPGRSARSYLTRLARAYKIPPDNVDSAVDSAGLTEVAERKISALPAAMAHRVAVAAALLGDPEVLLLDDPASGLDPQGVLWLRRLTRRLAGEGRTVLVSSKLLAEMAMTVSDLIVLDKGKLLWQGSVEDYLTQATEDSVKIRAPHLTGLRATLEQHGAVTRKDGDGIVVFGMDSARITDLAAEQGWVIDEATPRRSELEEAFSAFCGSQIAT
ncbi:MAG: type transport system ATP-binding protein [Actinomycetota bacterium]|nr:type transport system ATP-binding protein [Actinomycetota bacterium]